MLVGEERARQPRRAVLRRRGEEGFVVTAGETALSVESGSFRGVSMTASGAIEPLLIVAGQTLRFSGWRSFALPVKHPNVSVVLINIGGAIVRS